MHEEKEVTTTKPQSTTETPDRIWIENNDSDRYYNHPLKFSKGIEYVRVPASAAPVVDNVGLNLLRQLVGGKNSLRALRVFPCNQAEHENVDCKCFWEQCEAWARQDAGVAPVSQLVCAKCGKTREGVSAETFLCRYCFSTESTAVPSDPCPGCAAGRCMVHEPIIRADTTSIARAAAEEIEPYLIDPKAADHIAAIIKRHLRVSE